MQQVYYWPAGHPAGEDVIGHHHAIGGIVGHCGDGGFDQRDAEALGEKLGGLVV